MNALHARASCFYWVGVAGISGTLVLHSLPSLSRLIRVHVDQNNTERNNHEKKRNLASIQPSTSPLKFAVRRWATRRRHASRLPNAGKSWWETRLRSSRSEVQRQGALQLHGSQSRRGGYYSRLRAVQVLIDLSDVAICAKSMFLWVDGSSFFLVSSIIVYWFKNSVSRLSFHISKIVNGLGQKQKWLSRITRECTRTIKKYRQQLEQFEFPKTSPNSTDAGGGCRR